MLAKRVDRLRRVRRVAFNLYHAGSRSEPTLEPHTAQGADSEFDSETGHHGSRATTICALDTLDVTRNRTRSVAGCAATLSGKHPLLVTE